MKRKTLYVTAAFASFLSIAALGIGAAVDSPRTLMAPADYARAKQAIEGEARAVLAKCGSLKGSGREICKAQARGEERIRKADLQARYHGTVAAGLEAREERVKSLYDIARARCGERVGEQREECLSAARDERDRTLASAGTSAT